MIATLKKGRRAGDVMGSDLVADEMVSQPPPPRVFDHAHSPNLGEQIIRTGNLWHFFSWKGYHTTHIGGTYVNGILIGETGVLTGGR